MVSGVYRIFSTDRHKTFLGKLVDRFCSNLAQMFLGTFPRCVFLGFLNFLLVKNLRKFFALFRKKFIKHQPRRILKVSRRHSIENHLMNKLFLLFLSVFFENIQNEKVMGQKVEKFVKNRKSPKTRHKNRYKIRTRQNFTGLTQNPVTTFLLSKRKHS